jgi:Tol biopolymer transport system component
MVMDGVESKEYDGIDYAETLLIFSLDSKRVAFVAQHGDKHCAVVDGVNGMDYDYIAPRTLNFSPDSKHVAYIARRGNKSVVVIDGVEGKEYEGIGDALVFSPDSTRVAYVVWHGRNKQVMVVDGAEGKEYESVGSPIFSPDSKRVVYTAWREKKTFMVIDGVEGKEYDGIGYKSDGVSGRFQSIGARRSVFSPDSQHYAYTAWRGDKWFVVVDGVESKEYNGIGDSLIFSPDSKRLAYAVRSGRQACVVINGREGPGYQGVLSPIFSPDSKRVAYIAYDYNSSHMTIVADGLPPIGFDDIFQGSLTFSPDSKHFAFCAEISDGHLTIVIDGIQSKDFDFDNISYPVFESSSKLRVMITRHFVKDHNYKLFRLDIEIPN